METSTPLPFEQQAPSPDRREDADTLPTPVEQKTAAEHEFAGAEQPILLNESEIAKEAVKKRPEVVLAHVKEAAEKGEAQEAVYELRHEIKDETSQPVVPVGSVVAKMKEQEPALTQAVAHNSPPKRPEVGLDDMDTLEDRKITGVLRVYRKPMLVGFTAALAGIGLFIIVSLIVH